MTNQQSKHSVSFSPPSEGSGEASLLIANRGEIAVRIIRAAKKNGIHSVAIYAADDAGSLHVSMADEAVLLSGRMLAETYLNQKKIIEVALEMGVDAIHPGYGFLSENADFAQKVTEAGLVFIGPTPENIRLMGEKNRALAYVESIGIPILKSFRGTRDEILKHSSEMEFPVMVKASGGGGGKGMVICQAAEELFAGLQKAGRQALDYFGNGELFVEKYLPRARHIEVQIMADHHGNVLHFFERECSVQRRFQKIIEEAPSPSVDEKLRAALTASAVKIARSMHYRNAGTIEFLLDENGQFYFLEMNTRIQVEHPVTEMITNSDLVSMQIQVAAGKPITVNQDEIQISGHAIEVRMCAEDAENNFKPSAGKLELWETPENDFLRVETFVKKGLMVSSNYDSLLAKLVVWGTDRNEAISLMKNSLERTWQSGLHTNLPFLSEIIESEEFRNNHIYTCFIDENLDQINHRIQNKGNQINRKHLVVAYLIHHFYSGNPYGNSIWNQIGYWRMRSQMEVILEDRVFNCSFRDNPESLQISIDETPFRIKIICKDDRRLELEIKRQTHVFYFVEKADETIVLFGGFSFAVRSNSVLSQVRIERKKSLVQQSFQNLIYADLFGKVLNITGTAGDEVRKGEVLLTLESMKTEIHVLSPADARIKKIHVKPGEPVIEKQLLLELEEILQVAGI